MPEHPELGPRPHLGYTASAVDRAADRRDDDAALAKFRQDLARGVARDVAIIQARKAGATLQAIGNVLGLTKERVRQIIDRV